MKKRIISLVMCFLMIAATAFASVSCVKKPKSADDVWKKIDESMEALASYESEARLDITYYVSGIEVKGSSLGKSSFVAIGEDDFYYCSDMEFSMNADEIGLENRLASKETYSGGKLFIENDDGYVHQMIYSDMTPDEAEEYLEGDSEDEIKFENATSKAVTKNEDSSYTLVFEGYKAEDVEKIQKEIGLSNDLFPNKVIDVKVTVTAGEDYLVSEMKIEFVFEQDPDSESLPLVAASTVYSKYNSASRKEEPDVSKFTEIEDIKIISDLEDMLHDIEETKDGKFTLNIDQTLCAGGEESIYSEKDVVEYGKNENGYFYTIDAIVSGSGISEKQSVDISYSGGMQTVKSNGQTQSAAQTDAEAKSYINSLINTANYSSIYVSKVEKPDTGNYKIICEKADPSDYESFFQGLGGSFVSAKQTINFVVAEGKIIEIKTTLEAQGKLSVSGVNETVTLNIEADIVYNRVVLE